MENNFDTICAIITPQARSAVGIVRISGVCALDIASKIFSKPIVAQKINHGYIKNGENTLDEVVLLYFKAPNSYTGEDVIEIQTHGNPVILNSITDLIFALGARPAQRGEFTKRAFLNHRLDLTQSEAVLDIIDSKSQKSAAAALTNLGGYLKEKINLLKKDLISLYSRVIASVDFPEDVREVDPKEVERICSDKILEINDILKNASCHNFIRDGINICLIGAPNAGKSSLFNALLNYNRAIVTNIEGTTRDTISETLNLDGFLVNFVDTAGIRDKKSADEIEAIGIENSIETIKKSDIVLFLSDNSKRTVDKNLLELAQDKIKIFVKTKCDLDYNDTNINENKNIVKTSALTGTGIDCLKDTILSEIKNLVPENTKYLTNKRQQTCLLRAKTALEQAIKTQKETSLSDLTASDLKDALLALDEITGEVLTDKILDNIFDNFCIGK